MARALFDRRVPRHRLLFHRQPASPPAVRTSDLVLALLGVALLGGLALAAAYALAASG